MTVSPIRTIEKTDTFITNIFYVNEYNCKSCGIQIPQYHVAYRRGFDDDDIADIKVMLHDAEKTLWEYAAKVPPLEERYDIANYIIENGLITINDD
jgi:hypothetical protein